MPRRKIRIVIGLAAAGTILIVSALAVVRICDAGRYRDAIQEHLASCLGIEVLIDAIEGNVLFSPNVVMKGINGKGRSGNSFSCREAIFVVNGPYIFNRRISVRDVTLVKPIIHIVQGRQVRADQKIPKQKRASTSGNVEKKKLTGPGKISILQGDIFYSDENAGVEFAAKQVRAMLTDITVNDGVSGDLPPDISFSADAKVGEVRVGRIQMSDLECDIRAAGKNATIRIKDCIAYGGLGEGRLVMQDNGGERSYALSGSLSRFRSRTLLTALSQKLTLLGAADIDFDVSWTGRTWEDFLSSVDGTMHLKGRDLCTPALDLDEIVSRLERGSKFTLLDAGTYFFAGPLGMLVTKGRDLAALRGGGSGADGYIRELVSLWEFKNGVANARDAALATNRNRIALRGALNLKTREFISVWIASVDRNGVARFSQSVTGTFANPEVKKTGPLTTVTNPFVNAMEATGRLTGIRRSVPFYTGSVIHPGGETKNGRETAKRTRTD